MKPDILIVDDEPEILEGLRRTLGTIFNITTVSSGEAAIAQIETTRPYSIVMSDMRMPQISGVEVLEAARRRCRDTVRIILSGFTDFESAAAAINRGAVDQMIAKPASRDILISVLNDAGALNWERRVEQSFRNHLPSDVGEISMEMVDGLKRREFSLMYQPQINIRTGTVVGLETLMRWNSRKYGIVSPATFIQIAELSGYIIPLTNWLIEEATQQMADWINGGMPPVKLAVNVSPRHIEEGSLLPAIKSALLRSTLPAELLEIEITESAPVNMPQKLTEEIEKLREIGVDVGLDDFGSGFCSLSHVERFHVSKLKLDKSLIDGLRSGENGLIILDSMVEMTKRLGLKLVAEGVETESQLKILERYGCEIIQGYYFSPPLLAEDVMDWVDGMNTAVPAAMSRCH